MSHDFKHKEPSKTERMIYELAMGQNSMEKALWSTSTVVMALGYLTKTKPEEIAELMVNGDTKLKEYSDQINQVIRKLEAEKQPKGEEKTQEHNHDHALSDEASAKLDGHDHSHETSENVDGENK